MSYMKQLACWTAFLLFALVLPLQAQILNPVKWSTGWKHIDGDVFELQYKANIQEGWNVYSMFLESEDGPIATSVNYDSEAAFERQGKPTESGTRKEGYDKIFEMNLVKFAKTYTITQRIRVKDYNQAIKGYLNFMTCDDEQCLPPTDVDFSFRLTKEGDGQQAPAPAEDPAPGTGATQAGPHGEDPAYQALGGGDDEGILRPAKWSAEIQATGQKTFKLRFKAVLDDGWHIYTQYLDGEDGPIPTAIVIEGPEDNVVRLSEFAETGVERVKEYDQFFDMELVKFKKEVVFEADLEVNDPAVALKGYVEFMVCDKSRCLPPTPIEFTVYPADGKVEMAGQEVSLGAGKTKGENTPVYQEFDYSLANSSCENGEEPAETDNSWFWIFLLGFGGGLLAILTPCVFPMIPLTISFFTKHAGSKSQGLRMAIYYGLSIIAIYLLLGLLITGIFGADALNLLSTNAWFNIFFCVLFIVFAFSFFGYFEITLPSSWVNRADQASEKGGLLGIFFMAFTLSLVSFSCTGPIIGTLLVETATGGGATILGRIPVAPLVGMFGFALALALPFTLFAAFPGWLNSLPRSGSWMNGVKVTLGFAEIALALKFLSVADLTMGWKILPYEAFVAAWVLCALGLAAYYFGWIHFPHDSRTRFVSNVRKAMGAVMVLFAVYLGLGFRYSDRSGTFVTPNLLSGLAPPAGHSYIYPKSCPLNLDCFKDYDEGIAFARKEGKPVMIDFTGHGCVNCRRMEDQVWGREGVFELLRDKYVIISLYVDERKELDQPYESAFSMRTMRTVGNKWADFQAIHFNRNSQPYYVLAAPDGTILNQPVAYTPDVDEYRKFLECGLERFAGMKL